VRGAALVHVDLEVGPPPHQRPVAAAWSRWMWVSSSARGRSPSSASSRVGSEDSGPRVDQRLADLPAARSHAADRDASCR
jgi:hypothetical protein